MNFPTFAAVAPDPRTAKGTDKLSVQARALEAAGYTLEQRQFFFRTTDEKDFAARQVDASAMRV